MLSLVHVLGSTLGNIFHPLYTLMGTLIAFFYAVIPNYAVAIALLTVVVMAVTAPLTVKSTKSMVAMQKLSPELKKLQQKYKGDRQTLNEEMMKLYKEHGANPAGGCLPMVAQFPVFIILYGVIKGLANTVTKGNPLPTASAPHGICHQALCALPRYIGTSTKLYTNLVKSPGKINAFGINLADKVLGHHSVVSALPYALLILIAIGLQYLQMRQLNNRNPQFAKSNPQAQMMQRYMPLIFAVIYVNIAAGVNVYFIVSSMCRIGIQEAIFRSGTLDRAAPAAEGVLPSSGGKDAAPRRRTMMERLADLQRQALEQKEVQERAKRGMTSGEGKPTNQGRTPTLPAGDQKGPSTNGSPKEPSGGASKNSGRSTGSNGAKANGQGSAPNAKNTTGSGSNGSGAKKPTHPRSKTKRDRKDR
ncbi:MAG TPA: YidC/Oxa1 family membrane protein insertase [Acidimicrobiales bacterium]|nr:YidC/Oxa1 family membrane protein insertase [Acidimicrobiales bacterium]